MIDNMYDLLEMFPALGPTRPDSARRDRSRHTSTPESKLI